MLQELVDYAFDLGWIQWVVFLSSIVYVILAARENIWCWAFGLIGVSLSFVIYLQTKLYSDASLQIFYMIMSVYGWIHWSQHPPKQHLPIRTLPFLQHVFWIGIGLAGTAILGAFWTFFGAALPYIDAFTTSFSIIATFFVARKILENWIYWIIIDIVCVGVYIQRSIPLFAILFLVYTIIAVFGFFRWRKNFLAPLHQP
jgi:nicotinamide mononucleotide transporter